MTEAAERLRHEMRLSDWSIGTMDKFIGEALAAERAAGYAEGSRATVERIRARLVNDFLNGHGGFGSAGVTVSDIEAILDEEAARSPEGSKP